MPGRLELLHRGTLSGGGGDTCLLLSRDLLECKTMSFVITWFWKI